MARVIGGIIFIGLGIFIIIRAIIFGINEPPGQMLPPGIIFIPAIIFGLGLVVFGFYSLSKYPTSKRTENNKPRVRKFPIVDEGKFNWYCSQCDTWVNETDKTCPKCGAEFE